MALMALATPTLRTARLRLRPFADADAAALFALHSSAHVLRYWDSPPWPGPERAQHFIAACAQMAADGTGVRLAVERLTDGAFIGWCGLSRWNAEFRSAAIGYCYDDSVWGQGYATEAARAVLLWAFDALDLNRVQAETDTRNAASARVLAKLGFVREGTLREDCVVRGEVSDSWVFGLLRREWAAAQRAAPADHGRRLAQAIAAKDRAALLELLSPDVDFAGLTPGRRWEARSAEEVAEVYFGSWVDDGDSVDALAAVADGPAVEDTEQVRYRLHLTNADGRFAMEQHAYYRTDGARITYLRVLCSGARRRP